MSSDNSNGNGGGGDKVDKRRYNYMENVLQNIITKISVNDEDKKRHNQILSAAIEIMLAKMRESSTLFAKLYTRTFYGGSYYDNLKTGKPDEYDIDLLMMLSKKQVFKLKPIDDAPGFVTLQRDNKDASEFAELFDGDFLCTNKVLKWMESVVAKTLANLPTSGSQNVLNIQDTDFFIKIVKSGPAFTVKLNGQMGERHLNFDVDLVPCFVFNASMWPKGKFRANPVKDKTEFFIVPKQFKGKALSSVAMNHCWRLSFQEQERQLIHGSRTLKPCIKLIKKLRDRLQHASISSYFIKTMFIWHVERQEKSFWDNSLSYVFVEMLQVYEKHMRERKVEYFWNTDNNLIGSLQDIMVDNYANRVRNIINDIINKEANNPYYIAKYFQSEEEIEQLKIDVPMPVKLISNSKEIGILSNSNGGGGAASCKQCNCVQVDATLKEIRQELAEARCEQETLKMEILEILRVVVKRLDQMDTKLT